MLLLLTGAAASAVGVLSGCEQVSPPPSTSPSASTSAGASPTAPSPDAGAQETHSTGQGVGGATVFAYKLGKNASMQDANGLVPVPLKLAAGEKDTARAALESLTEGADSPLPQGTKVLGVVIDPSSKTASVNFSPELKSNFKGGETEEAQAINSVLQTLGQFGTIDKVRFLVDGKPLDTLGGAQDLSQPLPTPQSSQGSGSVFAGSGVKQ